MLKAAPYIDALVVLIALGSGLLHPSISVYYQSVIFIFLCISIPLFAFAFAAYLYTERHANRIQGKRKKPAPIAMEAFGTARAALIVSCMAAWPMGLYKLGYPTGMAWTLEEMGLTWWMALLQIYGGIVLIDAMTYWKHRLLHTKLFFPFHKHHHSFRDPTPFAGFAVGPVETILTFWPLLLICIPEAKHFAPLYFTAIVSFVLLNLYLHSGIHSKVLEAVLPKFLLNSSAWHNVHHSDVNANFGEVSYFWDKVCKTSREDLKAKKASAIS
ncbi:MAG: sterol desaturase family protein [Flavobacteriales bacterium]|nr:sterol desaturase family protein [Flavobacteriales bacterium]